MTGRRDKVSEPNAVGRDAPAGRGSQKRRVLPAAGPGARSGSGMIGNRLSMAGLALGYLGLVAILSAAPYWHQTLTPHAGQPAVCTDFGGSR